ncbi:MAG: VCBS repeat-containing protein [Verrucomicrobiales bacterium]
MESPLQFTSILGFGFLVAVAGSSCDSPPVDSETATAQSAGPVVTGKLEQQPLVEIAERGDAGAPLFTRLDPSETGVYFTLQSSFKTNIKEFMFITPLGGMCTGDYDADGLPDIYLTNATGGNRLFRNLGGFRFEDVTTAAGVEDDQFWGTGACFIDIDNDGDLDLFACGYNRPNKCYINDGSGRFADDAAKLKLDFNGASMMMSFADIDQDGDLDGYLATTAKAPPPGTKFGVVYEGEKPVIPEPLQEYWQFLYLPGKKVQRTEAGQFDRLFRNDGGSFKEVAKASGIDGPYFSLSATWWDYDADRKPDLYVSNDYTGPDMLYHNLGGKFENRIRETVPHTPWFSMGSDIGDVNNDGLIDFLAADMAATTHYRDKMMMGNMDDMGWFLEYAEPRQYMRNALYLNTGTGHMMEAAFLTGLSNTNWTWSPRLEDYDSDGRIDLFVTNGILRDSMNSDLSAFAAQKFQPGSDEWANFWASQPLFKEQNLAYRNDGDLKFTNVSARWGLNHTGVSFGAATADFDGDGDLDLVVNNAEEPATVYRNETTGNRIRVRLLGTESNHFGLGANVSIRTADGVQVRYLTSARGWLSASEPVIHFGLGDVDQIENLTVRWPSGQTQSFEGLPVNHLFTITEPGGKARAEPVAGGEAMFAATDRLKDAVYKEDPFDDFVRQPLLPNKLSQSGPAMAWADVDCDGDSDGFLGGSAGYPGQLLRNNSGKFSIEMIAADDAVSEDAAAVFFDADGDGDQDLYVVSGSVEKEPGDSDYRDRLYLNDGSGAFTKAPEGALPDLRDSGGCVAAADFDQDGDLDLFVGGRSIPGRYPETPASRLLINTGDARFIEKTPEPVAATGLATAVAWSDANSDGWLDLLVTHEWGPVKLFLNDTKGSLSNATEAAGLAKLLGWWNGIAAGDIDGDGDTDYAVTNYGLNTKYKASESKPALIYYGDFDGTGKPHLVEAKFEGSKALPRRGFSCSSGAMPLLKTKLKTFHNFASASLEALYPLEQGTRWEANTLESGILINDGSGTFTFQPFPRLAQIAPAFGVLLNDIDGDGALDCVLAQNTYSPQRETGHMDGGLSLLLKGDGKGQFEPVWPTVSGIVIPSDAVGIAEVDLNGDGREDLVFSTNNGPLYTFEKAEPAPSR